MKWLKPEPSVNWGFYHVQWPSPSYWWQGQVQSVGAETLRVRYELVLFPLSRHSPLSQSGTFTAEGSRNAERGV